MKTATLATLYRKLRRGQTIRVELDGETYRYSGLEGDGTYAYLYPGSIGFDNPRKEDAKTRVKYDPKQIRLAVSG